VDRPVSEFVDRNAPTLKPDASAMEAFRLVCRSGRPIAVIAHDSGKFEGIITYLDAFRGLIHASS
jgi:CBS domain-containing protein